MKSINELHEAAMELADQAFIARRRGDSDVANELSRKAYERELKAAEQLRDDFGAEPSRSVLYRSAASLAMECGEIREAERLISVALIVSTSQFSYQGEVNKIMAVERQTGGVKHPVKPHADEMCCNHPTTAL